LGGKMKAVMRKGRRSIIERGVKPVMRMGEAL
jgi:hypothetical protein